MYPTMEVQPAAAKPNSARMEASAKAQAPEIQPDAVEGKKMRRHSDPVKNPENYMTNIEVPRCYSFADIYAMFITLALSPGVLFVFILGVVLNSIPLVVMELYRMCLPRPLESINRSTISFYVFLFITSILYLPLFLLAIVWSINVLIASISLSLPWAVCNCSTMSASMDSLAKYFGNPGSRGSIYVPADKYARGYSFLYPGDIIVGFIGAKDRQGFCEFFFSIPIMISVVPVMKIVYMVNPLLYDLSEISYINQWSVPLDANCDSKVNDDDAAIVVQNVKTHVSQCRLSATNRSIVDTAPFAGHYPYPPKDRKSKSSAGVQYSRDSSSALITHTTHSHDIKGYVCKSRNGRVGIYSVYLMAWNPWHHLCGYVEVNFRNDGRVEHPMWLLADKSSRFHCLRLQEVNELFVKLGTAFRGYLKAQDTCGDPKLMA